MPVSDDSQADPFAPLVDLAIPDGEELYDKLMGPIEPELLSASLPLLEEKYKNETPEQATLRGERYAVAFAEYDKQLNAYMDNLNGRVQTYQRTALHSAEAHERKEETADLAAIEQQFNAI